MLAVYWLFGRAFSRPSGLGRGGYTVTALTFLVQGRLVQVRLVGIRLRQIQ